MRSPQSRRNFGGKSPRSHVRPPTITTKKVRPIRTSVEIEDNDIERGIANRDTVKPRKRLSRSKTNAKLAKEFAGGSNQNEMTLFVQQVPSEEIEKILGLSMKDVNPFQVILR